MGSGPLLVALHGGPGLDHTTLLPLARELARHFEVWLPDLPGHGRSALPSGRAPGLAEVERRLDGWLRRHAPEPAVLLGHSLGAWLARERVRGGGVRPGALVLLAPPVAGREPAADGRRSAVRRVVGKPGMFFALPPLDEVLDHVRSECGGQVPPELRRDIEHGKLRSALDYGSLLRNLHRRLAGPLRPVAAPCPKLVLCGEEDRTTPSEVAGRLALDASTRVDVLPALGHYLHAQDPKSIAARVLAFGR